MLKNKISIFGIIILFFVWAGCENGGAINPPKDNNSTENSTSTNSNSTNSNGKETGNSNNNNSSSNNTYPTEKENELEGSWIINNGDVILTFQNGIILFKKLAPGGYSSITHNSFKLLSYDGTTVKFSTYLEPPSEIAFTATISDNQLTVSGLVDFAYSMGSLRPIYFNAGYWNGGYTKREDGNSISTNPTGKENELEGSWINGGLILTFQDGIILFKQNAITHRSFKLLSYDGTIVKFSTYLDPPSEVAFTATISDNKLTVSELGNFIVSAGSLRPVYFNAGYWNGVYTKRE